MHHVFSDHPGLHPSKSPTPNSPRAVCVCVCVLGHNSNVPTVYTSDLAFTFCLCRAPSSLLGMHTPCPCMVFSSTGNISEFCKAPCGHLIPTISYFIWPTSCLSQLVSLLQATAMLHTCCELFSTDTQEGAVTTGRSLDQLK